MTRPPEMKILLVGDFPPPSGGVATHVEELFRAVRARGGECEVLDIGKGQLPAEGVVPAGRAAIGIPEAEVLPAFSAEFLYPGPPPPGLPELRASSAPLFCAMVSPRPEYGLPVLLRAFESVRVSLPSAALALYGTASEDVK